MHHQDPELIVVDRSLPEALDDAEVRAWARDQTVFVSSVIVGMEAERAAVAGVVERLGAQPMLFERLGGRDDDAQTAYLEGVRASDIYVGILGPRYGRPASTGYAATHVEYNEAVHSGLRLTVWATRKPVDGPQNDFIDAVRVFNTTGSYDSPGELAAGIERRLRELAAEDGSPWCKVGPALFRARTVTTTGKGVRIEAAIRDADVLSAIESMRADKWSGPKRVRITWRGGTFTARLETITVSAGAGRARAVTIEGEPVEDQSRSSLLDVAFESRTPEDLTELAVRIALFNEPNPLGRMGFFAQMENPFRTINALRLSEDAVGAVAEILLIEELVGSGRAERLTKVRVGPVRQGKRRVALEWLPRQRYTNVGPERRRVEGEVAA